MRRRRGDPAGRTERQARHESNRPPPPPAGRRRRALAAAGWSILIAIAGLAVIGGAAELGMRAARPFLNSSRPDVFVPGVGHTIRPGAEVRHTN